MDFKEQFVNNRSVNIHYLETEEYDENLTPLLYVPGAMNSAEQFINVMKFYSPRRCTLLSFRGRGQSEAPFSGYSLEHHVSDIESVVGDSKVHEFCLMAYSMGVPYAISFASKYPEQVKGLILCDYPAKYPSIQESWSEMVLAKGHISEERHHVVKGIQRESREIMLDQELRKISCPVLLLKGGTDDSFLKNPDVEVYINNLRHVDLKVFEASGHELWVPDFMGFINTIKHFLITLDNTNTN